MYFIYYLVNIRNSKGLLNYIKFVEGVYNLTKQSIIIICESNYDKNKLEYGLKGIKTKIIININSNEIKNLNTNNIELNINSDYIKSSHSYLFNVENKKYKNENIMHDDLMRLRILYHGLIQKHKIQAAIVFSNQTFRSVGLIMFQKFVKKFSLPFYYLTRCPIKGGRYLIYDSIYYDNHKFANEYNKILNKGINLNERKYVDKFIKDYFNFKLNVHMPYFQSIGINQKVNKLSFIKYLSFSKIINNINKIKNKSQYSKILNRKRNPNKPYVLLLLTKPNHWFTVFANPDLVDRNNLIQKVWLSIPNGHDLVLKPHPRSLFDFDLINVIKNKNNCFIEMSSSIYDIVDKSSIVIFTGSTSGVEALLQFKHVIEIGKRSIIFNFPNSPVKRAKDLSEIESLIDECLKENPPNDKIYAFLFKLLKESFALTKDYKKIKEYNNLYSDINIYKNLSYYLIERMEKDKLLYN